MGLTSTLQTKVSYILLLLVIGGFGKTLFSRPYIRIHVIKIHTLTRFYCARFPVLHLYSTKNVLKTENIQIHPADLYSIIWSLTLEIYIWN